MNVNVTTDDLFLEIGRLTVENRALRRDLAIVRAMLPDPDPPDAPASMPLPEAPSDDSEGASTLKEAA